MSTQLKYAGVLETTRIRRLGFSYRVGFGDFLQRYSMLVNPLSLCMPATKESCIDVLQKLGLTNWKIGRTKLFLKYYHADELSRLYDQLNRKVTVVQCVIRGWLASREYLKKKSILNNSAVTIQRCKYILIRCLHLIIV